MSEQVARHVEECAACQEETAILSNTVLALNTGTDTVANLDARFSRVLTRVRDFERDQQAAQQNDARSFATRIGEWFGFSSPARLQWAGAFTIGLAVGIGALLVALPSGNDPQLPQIYETHSTASTATRLQIDFVSPPEETVLADLGQALGEAAVWRQQSDTRYLVELPDDLTVGAVMDIRKQLLGNDSVVAVDLDIGDTEPSGD